MKLKLLGFFLAGVFVCSCSSPSGSSTSSQVSVTNTTTTTSGTASAYFSLVSQLLLQDPHFKNVDLLPCVMNKAGGAAEIVLSQDTLTDSVSWFFSCAGSSLTSVATLVLSQSMLTQAMVFLSSSTSTAEEAKWLVPFGTAILQPLNQADRISVIGNAIATTSSLGFSPTLLSHVLNGAIQALSKTDGALSVASVENMSYQLAEVIHTFVQTSILSSTTFVGEGDFLSIVMVGLLRGIGATASVTSASSLVSAALAGAFSFDFGTNTASVIEVVLANSLAELAGDLPTEAQQSLLDSSIVGLCVGLVNMGAICSTYATNIKAAAINGQKYSTTAFPSINLCPEGSAISKDQFGNCLIDSPVNLGASPMLVSFTPGSKILNSIPSTLIAVFDGDIGSIPASAYSVRGTCSTLPAVTGSLSISADKKTCIATLSGGVCEDKQTLTISLAPTQAISVTGVLGSGAAIENTYVVDKSGPVVSLGSPSATMVNSAGTVTIPMTVADSVAGGVNVISTLSNAVFLTTVSGNPSCSVTASSTSVTTANIVLSGCVGNGSLTVHMNAATATDSLGNGSAVSSESALIQVDNASPMILGLTPSSNPLRASPSTVIASFSEPVEALVTSDFVLSGNCTTLPTVSLITMASDSLSAVATLIGGNCANGQTITVNLSPAILIDPAGNVGTGSSSSVTYTIESNGPSVTIGTPSSQLLDAGSTSIMTMTITASTSGGTALTSLLTASGGGISVIATSEVASCHAQVSGISTTGAQIILSSCSGNGTVVVQVQSGIVTDALGNLSAASLQSLPIQIDTTPPTLSSISPTTGYVNPAPYRIIATFSEGVTALGTTRFVIGGTCSVAPTVASVVMNGDSTVATATLSGGTCTNLQYLTVALDPVHVTDLAGNPGVGNIVTQTYTVSTAGPSASVGTPSSTLMNSSGTSTLTLTYTPSISGSTSLRDTLTANGGGVTLTPVSGGTPSCTIGVSNMSASGATITLSACTGNRSFTVHVNAQTAQDVLGNLSTVSGESSTITIDNTPPTVSSTSPSNGGVIFGGNTSLTVTFSEAVTTTSSAFSFSTSTCTTPPVVSSITGSGGSTITVNYSSPVCTSGQSVILVTTLSGATDNAGNAGTGTSTVTFNPAKRIFVTNSTHNGNFGSGSAWVTGADNFCASDINKPSTGSYHAMLVDGVYRRACSTANCSGGSGEGIAWVLAPSTVYTWTDGTPVGTTTSNGIFSFPLTNCFGNTGFSAGIAWTGFTTGSPPNWLVDGSTCSGWSSAASYPTTGAFGSGANNSDDRTGACLAYSNYSGCNTTYHLYCVEQ